MQAMSIDIDCRKHYRTYTSLQVCHHACTKLHVGKCRVSDVEMEGMSPLSLMLAFVRVHF